MPHVSLEVYTPVRLAKRKAQRPSTARPSKDFSNAPKAGRPYAPGYGIVGANDGKGLLPWSWIAGKLNTCRTFWIATIYARANSEQGRPHVMPIWGVWVDDAFCFSTGRKSRKGQNLAANAACTITNDDGKEAVIIEGMATEVEDAAALERIASAYKKKYKMDPRGMKEPIFAVRPRTVFGFIEKSFPKSATRWKL